MSGHKGRRAELMVVLYLMQSGHEVLTPEIEYGPADVVFRLLGHDGVHQPWQTGQVKAVYQKDGHPTVNLVRSNGERYYATDATILFAVDEEAGILWSIPFHLVSQYGRLRLTEEWDRFKSPLGGQHEAQESG